MRETLAKDFIIIECYCCGVLFGVTDQLHGQLKKAKQTFYCPNGHGQSYIKSTEEELREQIAAKQTLISDLQTRNAQLSSEVVILESKQKRKKRR